MSLFDLISGLMNSVSLVRILMKSAQELLEHFLSG